MEALGAIGERHTNAGLAMHRMVLATAAGAAGRRQDRSFNVVRLGAPHISSILSVDSWPRLGVQKPLQTPRGLARHPCTTGPR